MTKWTPALRGPKDWIPSTRQGMVRIPANLLIGAGGGFVFGLLAWNMRSRKEDPTWALLFGVAAAAGASYIANDWSIAVGTVCGFVLSALPQVL